MVARLLLPPKDITAGSILQVEPSHFFRRGREKLQGPSPPPMVLDVIRILKDLFLRQQCENCQQSHDD